MTGAKYTPRSPRVGALCLALNMPQILRGVLKRIQCLSKDRMTIDGKQHSNCFYEAWLWHIPGWFEEKYHLVQSTGLPDGGLGSCTLANHSSSEDAPVIGEDYSATQGAEIVDTGSWPDFLWNINTDDILNEHVNVRYQSKDTTGLNSRWHRFSPGRCCCLY